MHKEAQAEPRTCYRCQRAQPLTEFYVEAEKRRAATRAEIAKCEVVCANCHRIRTKGRPPATRGRSRR